MLVKKAYEMLPTPVRLILSRTTFINHTLTHRESLVAKLREKKALRLLNGHVQVNRHGQLFPTKNTVIPRDILEPLESGCFALGDVADVDRFLAVNTLPAFEPPEEGRAAATDEYAEQWATYLSFCQRFVDEVSVGWLQGDNGYERSNEWCLFKEGCGAAAGALFRGVFQARRWWLHRSATEHAQRSGIPGQGQLPGIR
ncbi:hypothetical protein [Pseudomonas sp. PGPR40]|uniref:hypothetical protein n=1 Tax=Pseudomonas sp. PGPR40 TaxID=2913476 RepID=UPI001ED9E566|nr:hypothetical protein [Pseudomonas sp. PGPR40]